MKNPLISVHFIVFTIENSKKGDIRNIIDFPNLKNGSCNLINLDHENNETLWGKINPLRDVNFYIITKELENPELEKKLHEIIKFYQKKFSVSLIESQVSKPQYHAFMVLLSKYLLNINTTSSYKKTSP